MGNQRHMNIKNNAGSFSIASLVCCRVSAWVFGGEVVIPNSQQVTVQEDWMVKESLESL